MKQSFLLERRASRTTVVELDEGSVSVYGDVVIVLHPNGSGQELMRLPLEYCQNKGKIRALLAVLNMHSIREEL